ncbi:hypothetical protein G7Z17_g8350 [Cylindrodendrum hubeiense]|uniref:Uncharacterized protein n=1 Tax=Cylindrodendrum hubeiense TaxID=595255 RepID=A0A9P5LEE9_9HYPO|nr:hypothetical protein G7Z17_g8350 [Cylindrodendrum hubeiense]
MPARKLPQRCRIALGSNTRPEPTSRFPAGVLLPCAALQHRFSNFAEPSDAPEVGAELCFVGKHWVGILSPDEIMADRGDGQCVQMPASSDEVGEVEEVGEASVWISS